MAGFHLYLVLRFSLLTIGFTHCSTDVGLVTAIRRIENPSFSLSDFVTSIHPRDSRL
ncbi:unnamed protein product [Arabidopsis arenosa]|uniref:Uncharacterized protein n=1 Tax=Arabidopsis arenosa TaxID=38785 RepID=A0A8S1ZLM6_ARAAE|nr:unnamed protein product [Arabidopsis arenosa]